MNVMDWTPVTVSTDLWVRPADLDSLGHVNNARVLEYLEASRWHWLRRHGVAERHRVAPVVSRLQIDYVRQISLCALSVRTSLHAPLDEDLELAFRVAFEQVVLAGETSAEPVIFARANVEVAFIDTQSQTLSSIAGFLDARRAVPPNSSGAKNVIR
jgi:acyl-CoA thioesterase FadM